MSISDIGREAAQASTSEDNTPDGNGEYERMDVGNADFIRMHPGPTAIKGTITGLRYFAPYSDATSTTTRVATCTLCSKT
jgi:hypothetical protein